ncbi:putative adenine deaminase [Mycena venus]|uniref:Putative adenine deaminase n=1 Tax=Mycena venus TaxID=2733690 RepID=A0A8H6X759_9AGAR|nr:putative adenine deaminase [Mycena venus]
MVSVLVIFITLLVPQLGYSCPHSEHSPRTFEEGLEIARLNNARRAIRDVPTPRKTAIKNVRVFDGENLLPLGTIFIDGDKIVPYAEGAEIVDGNGGTLLPGLIDAHTHPTSVDHLEELASYGVTSTIVASCYPNAVCDSLKNHTGLTDVRFSGLSANTPNSTHALLLGLKPNETITSPSQAPQFVADQLAVGATFIKMVAERQDSATTLDQATMDALVSAAHANDLRVACHAADYAAVDRALTAHADQSHHVPTDEPIDSALIVRFLAQKTVSIPTLSIFRQFIAAGAAPPSTYGVANTSVTRLYEASIPILAGTDSNDIPTLALPYGRALHDELELLVQAGMSTVDVLRSATVLAAQHNLLFDRGVIAPGMRADLLLISGDPIANISATRDIQRVWIAGIEYEGVATS